MISEPPASADRSNPETARAPRFDFGRDTFAFPNELVWEYPLDEATGTMTPRRREPPPTYAHRCFVLVRAARQFFYHATFVPGAPRPDPALLRGLVRGVFARTVLRPSAPGARIVIPGFAGLRELSQTHESLLKHEGGGAWRSYVLRSHWRMVFPISRAHQQRTASRLKAQIDGGAIPIIHLVRFPQLTINHGMLLFEARTTSEAIEFLAYDPNLPGAPARLTYQPSTQTFDLPRNHYWPGGRLDILQIYQNWFL